MFENCQMEMIAARTILKDGARSHAMLVSTIEKYEEEQEYFLLATSMEDAGKYSLDNVYDCKILTEGKEIFCQGMVKERFWNKKGGMIRVKLCNGFFESR